MILRLLLIFIIIFETNETVLKAWRHVGRREVWPLAMSSSDTEEGGIVQDDPGGGGDVLDGGSILPNTIDGNPEAAVDDDELSAYNLERRSRQLGKKYTKYEVSKNKPIYILFPLPKERGLLEHNPFGITLLKVQPVVDEAISEVYRRQLVPEGTIKTHFEDTKLSDAHGPNVAIHALVKNQLDCIIGYAFVYALAPVARMSPHWEDNDSHGIPVITSIGLTANLDNRKEYQLMTRISSPYKVVKDAVIAVFMKFKWARTVYLFHDRRSGMTSPDIPYGECYLMMASLEPYLSRFHRMEHNYFMFNELIYDRKAMEEHLKKASMFSNGWFYHFFCTFLLHKLFLKNMVKKFTQKNGRGKNKCREF